MSLHSVAAQFRRYTTKKGNYMTINLTEIARENLAKYAHDAWSGWMRYLFEKSVSNNNGTITIPKWAVTRWQRQANTPYAQLPENEKESDRSEADSIIDVLNKV